MKYNNKNVRAMKTTTSKYRIKKVKSCENNCFKSSECKLTYT